MLLPLLMNLGMLGTVETTGGGTSKRDRYRKRRRKYYSDLDEELLTPQEAFSPINLPSAEEMIEKVEDAEEAKKLALALLILH